MIQEAGRHPSATARATGLSRMTVQRVRDGVSSPGLQTLREFALLAGYDVRVTVVPASDPAAAVAARSLLDPEFHHHSGELPGSPESADAGVNRVDEFEVRGWIERFERWGVVSPQKVLETAGRYAAPQHRDGSRFFPPRAGFSAERVIKLAGAAAASSHSRHALSGVGAADFYLARGASPGPQIVWAEDVGAVSETLGATLHEVGNYQPAGVIVAPAPAEYFFDSILDPVSGQTFVAPIQVALDLHGLGFSDLGSSLTEGW